MINNRQNGRRRGRGGQRPQGNPGQPGGGSRIDNRARGNAQQLHEKYKNLAQDAQRSGDRVTTEYYLQFADHYFRVLNENRARFEDQRRQNEGDEEFEGEEGFEFDARDSREPRDNRGNGDNRGQGEARDQREHRGNNDNREARGNRDRNDRGDRNNFRRDDERRDAQQSDGSEQARGAELPTPVGEDEGERRPRRSRRPRVEQDQQPTGEALEADRLPPAIAIASDGDEDAPAAPRRRTRRPRVETANDTVEVPPAA